jgi:Inverse autotransporter, beta-domain
MLVALLSIFCFTSIAAAQTLSSNVDENSPKLPGWFERTRIGFETGKDQKPRYYFETLVPLYQDGDYQNTFFFAPRINHSRTTVDYGTYNLGLGYRRLMLDNQLLLGLNTFWDARTNHEHYRMGFGSEIFYKLIEFRFNSYVAMSPTRQVKEDSAYKYYEKAVSGLDSELGLPVPYANWIKLYGGMYWYDYTKFDNKTGWKARLNLSPNSLISTNFIVFDDNKGDASYRFDVHMAVPFGGYADPNMWKVNWVSDRAYPDVDQTSKVLNRVEREYEIEVEKWKESKTSLAVIEIKRGN